LRIADGIDHATRGAADQRAHDRRRNDDDGAERPAERAEKSRRRIGHCARPDRAAGGAHDLAAVAFLFRLLRVARAS